MAFGQQSGPPASHSKIRELLELVERAGHADFRDARGALGLTQRQAGGKFTTSEADALIQELQEAEWAAEAEADQDAPPATEKSKPKPASAKSGTKPIPKVSRTKASRELRKFSDEDLAAELQRRGWIVAEP